VAQRAAAVKPKSLVELRTDFDTTRARIATRVNEIEGRLRTQVDTVLAADHPPERSDSMSLLDAVRLVNRLKGSAAVVVLAGAVVGFVAMRRWAPRRSVEPNA